MISLSLDDSFKKEGTCVLCVHFVMPLTCRTIVRKRMTCDIVICKNVMIGGTVIGSACVMCQANHLKGRVSQAPMLSAVDGQSIEVFLRSRKFLMK